ncbi:MAG: hypothetical protein ABI867_00710, partial [Kofleriaceae bacterium]
MKQLLCTLLIAASCTTADDAEVAVTTEALETNVVTNGSFETGDYTGWTLFETNSGSCGTWGIGSAGQVVNPGDTVFDFFDNIDVFEGSPGLPMTVESTDGVRSAMQLQNCGETHRMTQTITLPACQPLLQWDMRYTNHAG